MPSNASSTPDIQGHCRRISVITGSRADFGLLRPVMRAIEAHPGLALEIIICGEHRADQAGTESEVIAEFADAIGVEVSNQAHAFGADRAGTAIRMGSEIIVLGARFRRHPVDIVLVLGDRIEAFAAAAAAAVGGIRVAHVHGGDRAEGVADESLRHAITKLAHVHFAATPMSGQRIIAMGEMIESVHIVGSPALDDLASIPPLYDKAFDQLGQPQIIVLLHPIGDDDEPEEERAAALLRAAASRGRVLALHPNFDPGRSGIMRAIAAAGCASRAHLPRREFVGLLRRAKVLVGNSSAGLIEAAAIPIWSVNAGSRQSGREKPANVIDVMQFDELKLHDAIARCMSAPIGVVDHPYGDGRAGERIAAILSEFDLDAVPVRKRNAY